MHFVVATSQVLRSNAINRCCSALAMLLALTLVACSPVPCNSRMKLVPMTQPVDELPSLRRPPAGGARAKVQSECGNSAGSGCVGLAQRKWCGSKPCSIIGLTMRKYGEISKSRGV